MAKDLEHAEQSALMKWAALQSKTMPELNLLFAIPNGGHRHIAVAKKLKAEGVKSGVPDLMLPVAKGCWHGLFIEMKKAKGGVLSTFQKQWYNSLIAESYRVEVCHGWEQAREVLEDYLT